MNSSTPLVRIGAKGPSPSFPRRYRVAGHGKRENATASKSSCAWSVGTNDCASGLEGSSRREMSQDGWTARRTPSKLSEATSRPRFRQPKWTGAQAAQRAQPESESGASYRSIWRRPVRATRDQDSEETTAIKRTFSSICLTGPPSCIRTTVRD